MKKNTEFLFTEEGDSLVTEEGDLLLIEETEEREEDEADVISYEINSYPADMTLQGYVDKWRKGQILIPDFQREYVWDQIRASKLIESFMLGLPVPNVFLFQDKKTKQLSIVDGQQRIRSIVMFFTGADEFKTLKNVLPKWKGKTYESLDDADRYQLDDSILRATVIQQVDPDDDTSIYQIFERLNTGAVALNPMEIRKCVNSGNFFDLLEKLNTLPAWRELLGKKSPDKRLKDIELILRCLALRKNWRDYKKPMKGFLNSFMTTSKNLNTEELEQIEKGFTQTCEKLLEVNERPFHLHERINYALMDSVFYAVNKNSDKNASLLQKAYASLRANSDYLNCVKLNTSDVEVLKKRFEIALATFSNG